MRMIMCTILIILSSQLCFGAAINVPGQEPTIQAGINASNHGDTVLVQPGTYVEHINFNGRNIILGSLFLTTGDTSYISSTIIDGDSSGTCVTFNHGEPQSALITGFKITRGYAINGGGIYVNGASPSIINNIITQNFAEDNGGGMNLVDAKPYIYKNIITDNFGGVDGGDEGGGISCVYCPDLVISENEISNNFAYSGGGIACFDSDPIITLNQVNNNQAYGGGGIGLCCGSKSTITDNIISNNEVFHNGGGIDSNLGDSSVISNNIIFGNTITNWGIGGAIRCNESGAEIRGNLIYGNQGNKGGALAFSANSDCLVVNNTLVGNSAQFGGGIVCLLNSDPVIENCIIAYNSADEASVYCQENSYPDVICSDIYGNVPDDWSGCIADQSELNGNFSLDPLFCDSSQLNFNISVVSPCAPANNGCGVKIGSEEVRYCQTQAIIAIDKSGSMFYTDVLGKSRLERAKTLAHSDVTDLFNENKSNSSNNCQIAIMCFNATGIILLQDFTSDSVLIYDAIESINSPRHDTPLAAAMCQAHCLLDLDEAVAKYIFTYTDGLENESQNFDMCSICEPCNDLIESGWNFDCNPLTPEICTEWQICLNNIFISDGVNVVHYFGEPINPFDISKNYSNLEDMYFLKSAAEESSGGFFYHSDQVVDGNLCGDANRDFDVSISDAVYIINYVFVGGDAPDPIESGDANCDGSVNVSDAVYIINFVFVSGSPAPCDPDGNDLIDC